MSKGTIKFLFEVIQPWPLHSNVVAFIRKHDDIEERLIVDRNGRFCFQIHSSGNITEYLFQPIIFEGSGITILTIRWTPEGARMNLKDRDVQLDIEANGKPLHIKIDSSVPLPANDLIIGEVDLNVVKSHEDSLFISTVMDIDQKLRKGSRYDLIRAAGLLRQLFLDSTPLVHSVNRNYHQKISFETIDYRPQFSKTPDAYSVSLDWSRYPSAKTKIINLDDFMKTPCFVTNGVTATVRDLIRACANSKGGIHLGKTKTIEEGIVIDWDDTIRLFGNEPSLQVLADVCRVSLIGLKPLVNAILGSV